MSSLNLGGKESRAVDVIRGLDRARIEPSVGVLNEGSLIRGLEGVPVSPRLARFRGDPLLGLRLARLLRRDRPDVVWCVGADALASLTLLLGAATGVPIVVSFHGVSKPGRPLVPRVIRPLLRFAARLLAVSDAIKRELVAEGIGMRRVVVQLNGVDTGLYRPVSRSGTRRADLLGLGDADPVVGHVGSLLPVKGQDVLLEAFSILRKRLPQARLVMVGKGPREAELRQLAEALKIGEAVTFLGERSDVPELLRCFDLVMMSSWAEGCPNAVIEAMASGIAVVATRAGGTPEVVVESQTGFLADVGDAAGLARHALTLLEDPDRRREFGARSRKHIEERFGLDRMIGLRTELFEEVAG